MNCRLAGDTCDCAKWGLFGFVHGVGLTDPLSRIYKDVTVTCLPFHPKNYFNIWHLKIVRDRGMGGQPAPGDYHIYPGVREHWWQACSGTNTHGEPKVRRYRLVIKREKRRKTVEAEHLMCYRAFRCEQVINETFKLEWREDWEAARGTETDKRV